MTVDPLVLGETYAYFIEKAPVLFFLLSREGEVISANRYAENLTGRSLAGEHFCDVIIDFMGTFDLAAVMADSSTERLINIGDASGLPQSLYFTFKPANDYILAFGRLDAEDLENMRKEELALNNELNNLTRELHKKNAGLKKLNQELQVANEKIIELTRLDPLTQLANRRYFNERIEELTSLSKRKSQALSVVMTDIDNFKQVNDTFGHDAGDRVLVGYAELMKTSTRAEDLVARFGGEEFIMVLPLTDDRQAYALAERLRKTLSETALLENKHTVTASFGVSQLKQDETIADFIKRADAALYRAKHSGRNRTIVA